MKINKKEIIYLLENNIINKATIPLEKMINLEDEKKLIRSFGGPKHYMVNNTNTYKILGSIGGASLGTKLGLMADIGNDIDNPFLAGLANTGLIGLGFGAGGVVGSFAGKHLGQNISKNTLNRLGYKI